MTLAQLEQRKSNLEDLISATLRELTEYRREIESVKRQIRYARRGK